MLSRNNDVMTDYLQLATLGVRSLKPYEPGKPLEELERELGISEAIKLASNENPLGPGEQVRQAILSKLDDLSRYPDGNGFALKRALAEKHGVKTEQITLGNGSNDLLELLARAFVTTENQVVFSEHAFAVYPIVTQAVGARAIVVPAQRNAENQTAYGHDLMAMAEAVTSATRLIFIANPNNPTGTWLKADALEQFVSSQPDHVLVVIDEAYFEYAKDLAGDEYPDASQWVDNYPNVVVTRTFSKAYGIAGLRVGYAISNPEVANILNRVRQPFNVNSIAMAAAEAALADKEHQALTLETNRNGMRKLETEFSDMGLPWIPSVANFIAVDVGMSAGKAFDLLLHKGVIVRPIANYGMPDFLRVTIGLEHENDRFTSALRKVVGDK